ncbi:EpsG family protein [Chishuiella changwenlii]|uniref:EpsG family protein n=1 Tax=Chishuiella changwenlii TaxID=1434701 RepID=UPI002FDB7EC4
MIFLFILVILIVFSLIEQLNLFKGNIKNNTYYYAILIVLIIISAVRYRVGGDTLGYIIFFEELPTIGELDEIDYLSSRYNPLWYLLNATIKLIYNDFVLFQIIHSLFVNIIIFKFFKKYSNKNKYTLVLFYYMFYYLYFNMEILRESISIGIFLLNFNLVIEKKWKKYSIVVFICMLFHSSAIILIFLPFLYNKLNFKIILGIIITIIFLLNIDLMKVFSISYIPEQIRDRANIYLEMKPNFNGSIMQFLKILPTILIYFISKISRTKEHFLEKHIPLFILIGVLSMFFGGVNRFQNYLVIINLIYIVDIFIYILKNESRFYSKIFPILSITLLLSINFYNYYRDLSQYGASIRFYNFYYPYHTIFNPEKELNREEVYYKMMNF